MKTYEKRTYGNKIDQNKSRSAKQRAIELMEDKNRVVYAACIYRKRWDDIKGFEDYKYNVTRGEWIITMEATPQFHKRFLKLLNDPKTIKRFFKRIDWWKKHYHKIAKKNKDVYVDDEEIEEEDADIRDSGPVAETE
jgi:hypothetical protein